MCVCVYIMNCIYYEFILCVCVCVYTAISVEIEMGRQRRKGMAGNDKAKACSRFFSAFCMCLLLLSPHPLQASAFRLAPLQSTHHLHTPHLKKKISLYCKAGVRGTLKMPSKGLAPA